MCHFIVGIIALALALQGLIMTNTTTADGTIPLYAIINTLGDRSVAITILFISSILVFTMLLLRNLVKFRYKILLIILQQCILMIYAAGAISAVLARSYADNVLRSSEFIGADQIFLLLVFIIHTACMPGL